MMSKQIAVRATPVNDVTRADKEAPVQAGRGGD
jgi:hypothetical protein